ncbi:MAG: DNA polymerase III subunit gamma/tau [Mesorhizobium amorphae]|nr:MAG: DNA polymerase III subunit gamma/tau [Mesorhizobium amorphae]
MAEDGTTSAGSGASAKGGAYRVLARKYRPADFSSLIGQEPMVRTLTNAFASGRIAQAWMLTGVRGVGKTTTARILARALNYRTPEIDRPSIDLTNPGEHCRAIMEGRHVDVVEMDAASHTGIDDIREIIEQVRYAPVSARFKVYIVDEVHMLSTQAFNGLLKTLEEPPPHVKFIFATTEIRKVPITVLSRCQRFDLRRVEPPVLAEHLRGIVDKEGVEAEGEALALVARAAEGSVRDALSILDQAIAHGGGRVEALAVRDMLGLADRARVVDLFEHLMKGAVAEALTEFRAQYDGGADPAQVLSDLAEFTHLVSKLRFLEGAADAALSPDERMRGLAFSKTLSVSVLSRAWQMLLKGLGEVALAPRPASAAEMVLIRIAHAANLPTLDEALRHMEGGGGTTALSLPATPRPAPPLGAGPANGGGGGMAAAMARHAAPQAKPEPAPQETGPAVASIADIVSLAETHRDMAFKIQVKRFVRPVRIEPGRIEVSFAADAPPTLANDLSVRLKNWTGRQWFVSVSRTEGGQTLAEQETARREEQLSDARADPTVAAILARFPGSKIIDVRLAETEADLPEGAEPDPAQSVPIDPEDDDTE